MIERELQLALTSAVIAPIVARLISAVRLEHAAADRLSWESVVRLQITGIVATATSLSEWVGDDTGGASGKGHRSGGSSSTSNGGGSSAGRNSGGGHRRSGGSSQGKGVGLREAASVAARESMRGGSPIRGDAALQTLTLNLEGPLSRARFELMRRAARLPALLPKIHRRRLAEQKKTNTRKALLSMRLRVRAIDARRNGVCGEEGVTDDGAGGDARVATAWSKPLVVAPVRP